LYFFHFSYTKDDAAYTISKIGTMSTAVQLAKLKEIPINCIVSTLLPDLLKTEKTKAANPKIDYAKLMPPEKIGELIGVWLKGLNRPDNMSFVEFKQEGKHIFPHFI